MASADHSLFADLLRRYRKRAGLTQKDLARAARISYRTINDLENGRSRTAKISTARQLADAFQLHGEERWAFEATARGETFAPSELWARREFPRTSSNLPRPVSPFIGRTRELNELHALLLRTEVRLLTLLGPGGTGKTRIAIEAAREAGSRFADGVYFVPLATLTDPMLLLSSVAHALGLKESSGRSVEDVLIQWLRPKQALLVLDNLEHLTEAGPRVVALLQACPQVTVLATSRVVLYLSGEYLVPVPPMTLPPSDELSLDELTHYDATALFVERVRAAAPDVPITNETVPLIAAICARLDGLPLAIELAAAQSRLFPLAALVERLHQGLHVLGEGPRDTPDRQRTLEATIDWSYRLLDPADQALFARLSVFAGGATIDAVDVVCDGDGSGDMRRRVIHLLDASLLTQAAGDEPRLTMLETVREYAAQRLRERGEEDEIKRRHAQFYRDLSRAARPGMEGAEEEAWLARMEDDYDNIRAMLSWFLDRDAEEILRLSSKLGHFWQVRGYWEEGCRWLEEALARGRDAPAGLRGGAMRMWGWLENYRGNPARAGSLLHESIQLLRGTENTHDLTAALYDLGFMRSQQGELAQAKALLEETLEHSRGPDNTSIGYRIFGLGGLSEVARMQGDHEEAVRFAEEAVHLAREHDTGSRLMTALGALGTSAVSLGDYARGAAVLQEQLALAQRLGAIHTMWVSLNNLGEVAAMQGHLEEAQRYFERALALVNDRDRGHQSAISLQNLANILLMRGNVTGSIRRLRSGLALLSRLEVDRIAAGALLSISAQALAVSGRPVAAVRLHAASHKIFTEMHYTREGSEVVQEEQMMAHAVEALDRVAHDRAWTEGEGMSIDEAVELALGEIDVAVSAAQSDV